MRRRYLILVALLAIASVSGCATGGSQSKKALLVEAGQTKNEVISLMGTPGNRQFRGDDEAWQYCGTGVMTDDFTVIWFYQGRTTGVTTYQCTDAACGYIGSCTQGFRTIRWEDAPDRTIEVRPR